MMKKCFALVIQLVTVKMPKRLQYSKANSELYAHLYSHGHFCHTRRICNFILLSICCVHSFTEADLSDTDILPFENTMPITLINLLCILLLWTFFDKVEWNLWTVQSVMSWSQDCSRLKFLVFIVPSRSWHLRSWSWSTGLSCFRDRSII